MRSRLTQNPEAADQERQSASTAAGCRERTWLDAQPLKSRSDDG